eukprot:399471_1
MTLLSTTLIVVIVSMWALCVIARGYGHNVYDEYQDILYYKNDYNDGIQITDDAVEDIGDLWLDDNIWDEIEKIKLFDDVWILKKCVNYEADSMCACQSYAVYGNFGLYSCDVHISSSKYNDLSDNKYIDEYYADEDQMGNFNVGDDVLIGNLKKKEMQQYNGQWVKLAKGSDSKGWTVVNEKNEVYKTTSDNFIHKEPDTRKQFKIGEPVKVQPDAVPLDAVPLDAVPLDAVPLDAVPLDAVVWKHPQKKVFEVVEILFDEVSKTR